MLPVVARHSRSEFGWGNTCARAHNKSIVELKIGGADKDAAIEARKL